MVADPLVRWWQIITTYLFWRCLSRYVTVNLFAPLLKGASQSGWVVQDMKVIKKSLLHTHPVPHQNPRLLRMEPYVKPCVFRRGRGKIHP